MESIQEESNTVEPVASGGVQEEKLIQEESKELVNLQEKMEQVNLEENKE